MLAFLLGARRALTRGCALVENRVPGSVQVRELEDAENACLILSGADLFFSLLRQSKRVFIAEELHQSFPHVASQIECFRSVSRAHQSSNLDSPFCGIRHLERPSPFVPKLRRFQNAMQFLAQFLDGNGVIQF